jgi:hypothetical protein
MLDDTQNYFKFFNDILVRGSKLDNDNEVILDIASRGDRDSIDPVRQAIAAHNKVFIFFQKKISLSEYL